MGIVDGCVVLGVLYLIVHSSTGTGRGRSGLVWSGVVVEALV